jgi:diacylglycerol kinase (ATP)
MKKLDIIMNPASGQGNPDLTAMNKIFREAGYKWDISITNRKGDGARFVHEAIAKNVDLIVVYGGDGTVMDVASGLIGLDTPMGIIPAGTANVTATELGIPTDARLAAEVIVNPKAKIQDIDVGQINNKQYFIDRVGMGLSAKMIASTTRESKDRFGQMAYLFSALQALQTPEIQDYSIEIDGKQISCKGIMCLVCNNPGLGKFGLRFAPDATMNDGLLDVFVLQQNDMNSLLQVLGSMAAQNKPPTEHLQHFQGKVIKVDTKNPTKIQVDGEVYGETPFEAKIIEQKLKVIVR